MQLIPTGITEEAFAETSVCLSGGTANNPYHSIPTKLENFLP